MTPLVVTLAMLILLCAAAAALYLAIFDGTRALDERLSGIAMAVQIAEQNSAASETESEGLARMLLRWAARRVPAPRLDTPQGEKLAQMLARAGFNKPGAPLAFQLITFALAGLGAVLALLAGMVTKVGGAQLWLYLICGTLLGAAAPGFYIRHRGRIRQTAIGKGLSEALDLLVVCVEAGLGLHEAVTTVATECEGQEQAIGRELALVAAEVSAGATLGQAVRNMAERTGVEDVKPLAATLTQSEQLGTQIAPALRASSDALRARRRLQAEENAQKATIKILVPLVLFLLPALIVIILGPALIQIGHTLGP